MEEAIQKKYHTPSVDKDFLFTRLRAPQAAVFLQSRCFCHICRLCSIFSLFFVCEFASSPYPIKLKLSTLFEFSNVGIGLTSFVPAEARCSARTCESFTAPNFFSFLFERLCLFYIFFQRFLGSVGCFPVGVPSYFFFSFLSEHPLPVFLFFLF